MAAAVNTVRVCQEGQTVTFQPDGRSTVKHSLPLRRHAEQCLAGGATALDVDLRRCVYMDSTFLGTLLYLMKATACVRGGVFRLLSPTRECRQLIGQMGLDRLFRIEQADDPCTDEWLELPTETDDVCACKENVVQAHQQLATLPGPAGEQFREVVRCLDRETAAKAPH